MGSSKHHSGWPWVLAHLREHETPDGILFDDFLDRTIFFDERRIPHEYPYREPFVGIFHHAADCPAWMRFLRSRLLHQELKADRWLKVRDRCKGVIVLSRHVAGQLRGMLDQPVQVIKHPILDEGSRWSVDRWEQDKRVCQVGHYGRNVHAIWQLPPVYGCTYYRFKVSGRSWQLHNISARKRFKHTRRYYPGVVDRKPIPNEMYDDMLCSSVVLMELLTGSANNVVVECIVRGTPLLINPYPAAVEYLGPEYPLYYDDLDHAALLIRKENLVEAHEYLMALDKTPLQIETFVSEVKSFIGGLT
jgi:hypothetical protein